MDSIECSNALLKESEENEMSKKLQDLSLYDLMLTIAEKVSHEYVRENTCGNYCNTKTHVRNLLNRAGMKYVTDNQVTNIVNRDWRNI